MRVIPAPPFFLLEGTNLMNLKSWLRAAGVLAGALIMGLLLWTTGSWRVFRPVHHVHQTINLPNLRTIEAGRYAVSCANDECFRLDTVTGDLIRIRGNDTEAVKTIQETEAEHRKWEEDSKKASEKYKEENRKRRLEEIDKLKKQLKEEGK